MSHTLLYLLGYNSPEDALLPPQISTGSDRGRFDAAYAKLTAALRPWTIDFHVAQNDGTVYGAGSHDKTGRHCLATDPGGKLDIVRHAGFWLRGDDGKPTQALGHICWDGCMFPNAVILKRETWNEDAAGDGGGAGRHGWQG